jgi:hypothetical protein
MDRALLANNYSDFSAYEFQLEGPVPLASTGAVTPNRTLSGESLQTLHNVAAQTQWLAFGLDLKQDQTSFVFVWPKGELAPARYVSELAALEVGEIAEFLCQFPFAHCENTYFNEAWWRALGDADRGVLEVLTANTNPYYSPPEYQLDRGMAGWRLASHGEVTV